LQGGQNVAVHCRAGIGRSGMVAACSLVALGLAAPLAQAEVSKARGVAIPDTVEQGVFISLFAQTLKRGSGADC
jgi:protein-tyrosine phosphatase